MSTVQATTVSQERTPERLRALLVSATFAAIRFGQAILRIRHSNNSWLIFRILLGMAGAALVVLPLSLWSNWLAAPVGLTMFLASILLPPARPDLNVNEKARELGVLMVVNGGSYKLGENLRAHVRLFIGAEDVFALNSRLQPLLIMPCAEITSTNLIRRHGRWVLQVFWAEEASEFSYHGVFAEHFARAAQTSVAGVMLPPRPLLRKSRGAGA